MQGEGDPAEEIGHENEAAIEDGDHGQFAALVVRRDFMRHLIQAAEDGGFVVKDFADVFKHGGTSSSIAVRRGKPH